MGGWTVEEARQLVDTAERAQMHCMMLETGRSWGHGLPDVLAARGLPQKRQPLDQSVYDAAAWSVISPISAEPVADRGSSKEIPDFTRGAWRTAEPLGVVGAGA